MLKIGTFRIVYRPPQIGLPSLAGGTYAHQPLSGALWHRATNHWLTLLFILMARLVSLRSVITRAFDAASHYPRIFKPAAAIYENTCLGLMVSNNFVRQYYLLKNL